MLIRQVAEAVLVNMFERQRLEGNLYGIVDVNSALRAKMPGDVNDHTVIQWLLRRDFIQSWDSNGGEMGNDGSILLTDRGRDLAKELIQRAGSRKERQAYLHGKLVHWVHEHVPPGGRVNLQLFATHPHRWFCGTEVLWEEVSDVIEYLGERRLLAVIRIPSGVEVRLTALGIDFIHANTTLREFMERHQQSAANFYIDSNIIQGDAPGANLATGGNNSQTVNQGAEPDALAALIGQLRDIRPVLELAPEDAQDFEEGIGDLEREGRDPERGPRFWRSLRRILNSAATSATRAGAEAGVTQVLHAGAAIFD